MFETGRYDEAARAADRAVGLTEPDDLYPVAVATSTRALLAARAGPRARRSYCSMTSQGG